MKTVFCFGCSFTGGVWEGYEPRESWPYRLSLKRPDLKIYNFGKQASSILFTIDLIEQAKKQLHSDLIISQLTLPYRMTFYRKEFQLDLNKHLIQISDNYFVLSHDIPEICAINGVIGKKEQKQLSESNDNFKIESYKILEQLILSQNDNNFFIPEYRALVHRTVSLSDCSFFHKHWNINCNEIQSIPCVEKLMGPELFTESIIDKGYHFGKNGNDFIVDWLENKLNL